ncbi:hypothetical protein CQY20_04065 [Mycolicibacterium agri]|uniref:Uncharacterized protein n=1 Tax=Mycolicibacterium agri TaxID=36811 RepID=A0A2A7NF46_MYCAG|nr:hypothetical protein [Mycolicibacterium agri]PEG42051.1 hypothetical protein CQY20_04065 [Mycolicibacterium agri]GFG49788.1 hypothetical protein MAGR_12290 [Mycolicibacterium agri]
MPTTRYMTTVLPYSVSPSAEFHVSLYISHRLDGGGQLTDYPPMVDWVETLAGATIELYTDKSDPDPIRCEVLNKSDKTIWAKVFPPETEVEDYPTPKPASATWMSFPAHRMSDYALWVHYVSLLCSPVDRPGVRGNALADAVFSALRNVRDAANVIDELTGEGDGYLDQQRERLDRIRADRAKAAGDALDPQKPEPENPVPGPALHDAFAGQPWKSPIELLLEHDRLDENISTYLDGLDNGNVGVPIPPMLSILRDTRRAYRYYERKEAQYEPQPTPDSSLAPARTTHPTPAFHERVATACNVSALARKLGLIVDVKVHEDDLDRLKNAQRIWCDITLANADAVDTERYLAPATLCQAEGDRFYAQPKDDTRWHGGRMRIGRPDRYRVMDLDPDASALSLEQHLRSALRALAIEINGDRGSYAPAALRATGFAVAELDRAERLQAQVATSETLKPIIEDPNAAQQRQAFHFEGLLRGTRIEVWDDFTRKWHSLHERTVDVSFKTGASTPTPFLTAEPDVGHLQNPPLSRTPGGEDNPYYAHEVLAGWDGWSLSAPRPGKVIKHNGATTDNPEPSNPDTEIIEEAGGSVDGLWVRSAAKPGSLPALRYGRRYSFRIAGVDLAGNGVPMDQLPPTTANASLVAAAAEHLERLRDEAAQRDRLGLLESLRNSDTGTLPCYRPGGQGVRADVERATASVVENAKALTIRPHWDVDPHLLAALSADSEDPETVTAPRKFLRWDPIPAPALVPRSAYITGESLQRMVIRTGLTGSPGTCQRHIVPPKGSELEAEQDGRLDNLMLTGNRARAYAIALKERGNLFHTRIQDLNDPKKTVVQPGVELISMPGVTDGETLESIQDPDVQPKEGQYVIHNVDQLVVPYLPDPMANGVALVFYEAGANHQFLNPRVLQSVFVKYVGTWPELQPLRLVLHNADRLDARQDGNVIHVGLPQGEQVALRISTMLDNEHLAKMGLWVHHPVHDATVSDAEREVLADAARNGWMWWLTPAEEVRLVHATARPAIAPKISRLAARPRKPGMAPAALDGVLDVHGASTDKIELHARWVDRVDDPDADGPEQRTTAEVVADYRIAESERFSLLTLDDAEITPADEVGSRKVVEPIRTAIHRLPDTKARKVIYQLHGSSRYREFFLPDELPPVGDAESAGNAVEVIIPSSARPAPPSVHAIMPMFKWEEHTEPEHPFAVRRVRRSGVRIWLDRPWFSSGDGEMLAVITTGDPAMFGEPSLPGSRPETVSLWARDPIQVGPAMSYSYEVPILPAWQQRAVQLRLAPESLPGRPVAHVVRNGPVDAKQRDRTVNAYAYVPEFDPKRKRWFVDVILDSTNAVWPFLRLAVARYQPNSIAGQAFSPVVTTDFVQLPPERIGTLSRPELGEVRISLSGVTALTGAPGISLPEKPNFEQLAELLPKTRRVVATLQARNAVSNSDIDWVKRGEAVQCELAGVDGVSFNATWSAALSLTPPEPLATPSTTDDLRVQVEEYEIMTADPHPGTEELTKTERLVYADHFYL